MKYSRCDLLLVLLLTDRQEAADLLGLDIVPEREPADRVRVVHDFLGGTLLLAYRGVARVVFVRLLFDLRHIDDRQVLTPRCSPPPPVNSSGERYDVTIEDSVSSSVVVYWDVALLFLRNAEMIKDYMIRERN